VLGVLGLISLGFLPSSCATSNPFDRIWPPPPDGQGLNPLLQDIGLAIHPPLLYLGYVGYAITFAFAVAALIEGRVDAAWGRWVRPWTLAAWSFLTLGIALGSWWAYYELGWGGYWFWDPVENASLLPWLAGTALLHSAIVVEKREALKIWTVLLALLAFALSLLGTFLVRSGVLNSVHSFASDPARGVFILAPGGVHRRRLRALRLARAGDGADRRVRAVSREGGSC
jgi:cytochrome c-type biogenesis protein CcmF